VRKRRFSKAGVLPGRIGTKRSDRRFRAPDGSEWDSRYEWQVYDALRRSGVDVERCEKGGRYSIAYTQRLNNVACSACGSTEVGKQRRYTPDLFHHAEKRDAAEGAALGYRIELKGYLRAEERSLLRALCKARPDLDLRIVYQRDWRVSRKSGLTITQWTHKFLKIPYAVWKGKADIEWTFPKIDESSAKKQTGAGVSGTQKS
jgi:hypothetical protein